MTPTWRYDDICGFVLEADGDEDETLICKMVSGGHDWGRAIAVVPEMVELLEAIIDRNYEFVAEARALLARIKGE